MAGYLLIHLMMNRASVNGFGVNALREAPASYDSTSFVVVESNVALSENSYFVDNGDKIFVETEEDGEMSEDDYIIVTFYNVKVPALGEEQLEDRDTPVIGALRVEDSIEGAKYTAEITVMHPTPSKVEVAPDRGVKEDSIEDITVTYIVKGDIASGNEITVELPDDWRAAYPVDRPFFEVTEPATADRATTSYVEVTSRLANSTSTATESIGLSDVTITIDGDMESGDRIVVKYHNVKVPELLDRMPMDAQFTVRDTKISPAGILYAEMAQITVNPQELNTVTVTPNNKVQASSIEEDVKVTYTITDAIADSNRITIELPTDWEAAYANDGDETTGTAGFGTAAKAGDDREQDIDLDGTTEPTVMDPVRTVTSLPADTTPAMKSKASYVTVEYDRHAPASMNDSCGDNYRH